MFELIAFIAFCYIVWVFNRKPNPKKKPLSNKNQVSRSSSSKKNPSTLSNIPLPSTTTANNAVIHSKQTHLGTNNEQKLYASLRAALPSEYVIHCQVSLMALVKPVDFRDNSRTWAKRMDYVITDQSTKILAVIELDDSTHLWKKRKIRDKYVNEVLEGHHKLIRFQTQRFYDPVYVANVLSNETDIIFHVS